MPKKKPTLDPAHIETERILARLERRIAEEYSQASKEIEQTLKDYLRRFETKDAIWRQWVKDGKKTPGEYIRWRTGQFLVGKRWEHLKQQIAEDLHNANNLAKSTAQGYMPEVYALNHNFATYQIETGGLIDTSYTLYSRESVERMLRDDPELLPPPGKKVSERIAAGLDVKWNRQQIQSVMMQGVMQGESIPELAKRLRKVTDSNRKASIRNARTMATGAQNAGRVDAAIRARRMGVDLVQQWEAALDMRTRTDHRLLHGQRREIGEPFVIPAGGDHEGTEIMYPGDPSCGEPAEVYNCFVGTTQIATDSDIVRSYKHDYSGELVEVETACGVKFTCTPNHPILTPGGWIPAALLNNGDNLLIANVGDCSRFSRNGDIKHIHTRMKALYDALHSFGLVSRNSTLGVDFHGYIPTTNVEIITKEWKLGGNRNSGSSNSINEFLLKNSNKPLMRKRTFVQHFRRIRFSTLRFMGGLSKAFSFFWRSVPHAIIHGFGTVSRNNPSVFETQANRMTGNMQFFREGLDGLSCKIFADNIININITMVSHIPVYNLQTGNSRYFVNSIIPQKAKECNGNFAIAHNCRCTLLTWVRGYEGDAVKESDGLEGMTFEEWLKAKPVSNPIDLPERKASAIRAAYIAEYKRR